MGCFVGQARDMNGEIDLSQLGLTHCGLNQLASLKIVIKINNT